MANTQKSARGRVENIANEEVAQLRALRSVRDKVSKEIITREAAILKRLKRGAVVEISTVEPRNRVIPHRRKRVA